METQGTIVFLPFLASRGHLCPSAHDFLPLHSKAAEEHHYMLSLPVTTSPSASLGHLASLMRTL
jgi:hypothetical protein